MTNFIDHRISTRVSSSFRRVITGKTDIVMLASGRERRNAAWKYKRMKFTANYAMLDEDSQIEIASTFYAANAQLLLFRFRDVGDRYAEQSPLVTAALVGTRTPIQLTKRYTFGPTYADRVIQALVGTPQVFVGGSTPVAGAFDMSLGLFTPDTNWGGGSYTWTGYFDCWVRFNSDEFDATMTTKEIATTDVELIEDTAIGDSSGS